MRTRAETKPMRYTQPEKPGHIQRLEIIDANGSSDYYVWDKVRGGEIKLIQWGGTWRMGDSWHSLKTRLPYAFQARLFRQQLAKLSDNHIQTAP